MSEPLITVKEVAVMLAVTERTIYRLIYKGALPCYKVGGQWRFRAGELASWLDECSPVSTKGGRT